MGKKLTEQQAKINDDIFSYFDIVDPHPEVSARALSANFDFLQFINPTSILENEKASAMLLKNDHNNRWEAIFEKLDYVNDDIFLNIISQASNTTVIEHREGEDRACSVCAFYEDKYSPLFLDKICQNEMIKSYVDDLKADPEKIRNLCQNNFYFFTLAINFKLLDNPSLKEVFMDYYKGNNKMTLAQETFPSTENYKLARISIAFFENFNQVELNQMLCSYFPHYLKGYHLEKISPYLTTSDIVGNFITHSNNFFKTSNHYNASDYKGHIITFFRTLHARGDDTEKALNQVFNQIVKKHGHDLIYIFLEELSEEHFQPVSKSLLNYIEPKDIVAFLGKKNLYTKHIESLTSLPELFWKKVKKDTQVYSQLFDVFKKMDEYAAKAAYGVIPFIFNMEDSVSLINEYLNNYPKEMFKFPIFETLLEAKSLEHKLYNFIHIKIDDSWNIQHTVIETIVKNMKKDSTYVQTYHQEINDVLDRVFDKKSMRRYFHDFTHYTFNFDFAILLVEQFPNILLDKFSPNNDENFLLLQRKPVFFDEMKNHSSDIGRVKLQNFYWQERTKEFNELFSSVLQKEWEKNLDKNNNKELYQKFYFENAVIKEIAKPSRKLKI
jgi:hypothetical protein